MCIKDVQSIIIVPKSQWLVAAPIKYVAALNISQVKAHSRSLACSIVSDLFNLISSSLTTKKNP
jgi:hypothetical protein